MEMEALTGAEHSIDKYRPILLIEKIKSNEQYIVNFLEKYEYKIFPFDINLLALHKDDPIASQITVNQ